MIEYTGKERAFVRYSKVEIVNESLTEDTYEKFSIGIFGEDQQKQIFIIFYTFAGIPSMKLEANCASLDFLYECQDILLELSRVDKGNFKPDDLSRILLNLGIKDITHELNMMSK